LFAADWGLRQICGIIPAWNKDGVCGKAPVRRRSDIGGLSNDPEGSGPAGIGKEVEDFVGAGGSASGKGRILR
jgi:hypothetical protein